MSLTQRSYIFAALIVLVGVVDQWTSAPLLALWLIPGIALVLALVAELLAFRVHDARHLPDELVVTGPTRAELGESATLDIDFSNATNKDRLIETEIQWHESVEGETERLTFNAEPGQSTTKTVTFACQALGTCTPAKVHARTRGLFGLGWWQKSFVAEYEVTVVPTRLGKLIDSIVTDSDGGRVAKLPLGSGHEIREIRDYAPGDPMRNIDWKASARGTGLKVRSFDPDERLDIVLAVDSGRSSSLRIGALDRIGHSANLGARFCELAEFRGENVGLITYADKPGAMVPLGRGQKHLAMLRSALGSIESNSAESNPRSAVATLSKIVSRRALVIFITQIDEFDAAGELLSAVRLLVRKHHVVVASLVDEEIEAVIQDDPASWTAPYEQLAGLEYQNSVRHTRLELERYGVSVINAAPKTIEKDLFARYSVLKQRRAVG